MSQLSFKCQLPILIGASAFGYIFASKSHTYWCNACEEDRLIEQQSKGCKHSEDDKDDKQNKDGELDAQNSKLHHYVNTGIGCIGAVITSKVTYDIFLNSSS